MVEKTAPFKNIRRKDQPLKQSPVPMGSTSKINNDSGVKTPKTSSDNLSCNELPERCRGDHNLVKRFFIKTLHIQVLGNGIKASVHGSQGNHAWNQEV